MGVVDRIRSIVGRDEDGGYTYKCDDCGVEFESERKQVRKASCPACGSANVRTPM